MFRFLLGFFFFLVQSLLHGIFVYGGRGDIEVNVSGGIMTVMEWPEPDPGSVAWSLLFRKRRSYSVGLIAEVSPPPCTDTQNCCLLYSFI